MVVTPFILNSILIYLIFFILYFLFVFIHYFKEYYFPAVFLNITGYVFLLFFCHHPVGEYRADRLNVSVLSRSHQSEGLSFSHRHGDMLARNE